MGTCILFQEIRGHFFFSLSPHITEWMSLQSGSLYNFCKGREINTCIKHLKRTAILRAEGREVERLITASTYTPPTHTHTHTEFLFHTVSLSPSHLHIFIHHNTLILHDITSSYRALLFWLLFTPALSCFITFPLFI